MQVKSLNIGRLTLENNVLLAPLAGFTDFAFRKICSQLGAGLCFTEMVSAKGLKYNNQATKDLLLTTDAEKVKAVQLFGNDPQILRWACESKELEKFDIVDLNMGCPVPKVFNNGEGSALLDNIDLAGKIITECVKSGKIITVKMRLGVKRGDNTALQLAKVAQDCGASLVTIHGRSREDYYSGQVDASLIKKIKKSLCIPVIANGGIFTEQDAENLLNQTGADGVMLARGALNSPELFSQIVYGKAVDKKSIIKEQVELLLERYSKKWVATFMRKQFACYLTGVKGAKEAKRKIFQSTEINEILDIIFSLDL